jgi:N utilization substance protein A
MSRELIQIIEQVGREKGLPINVLIEAIEAAIESAARKKYNSGYNFKAEYDEKSGQIQLYSLRKVVAEVTNPKIEISEQDAQKIIPEAKIGDDIKLPGDMTVFGRISAQRARQIIVQKVKEAEKQKVYDQYKAREGEVILGTVYQVEKNLIVVDLGNNVEAILPKKEQLPKEFYRRGEKIRAYIWEVRMGSKGPQIVLSRACPEFLTKLFEIEVPEISEGIVEIKGVAREPGVRAKIGVMSLDKNVDPIGACVGLRGSRVQSIVRELRGEKIDIIEWSEDPAILITRALSPAKAIQASANEAEHLVEVIVSDDQFAIAIGKKWQNVKLISQLTGWRVIVKSESEKRGHAGSKILKEFLQIPEVNPTMATQFTEAGFSTVEEIAQSSPEKLSEVLGVREEIATRILHGAQEILKPPEPSDSQPSQDEE